MFAASLLAATAATSATASAAGDEPTSAESVQCAPSVEVPADRGRVIVHVLDANTQVRVPGAKLFISGDAGGREFETDVQGSRQIDGVPAGDYLVLADADQVGSDQLMITVAAGNECEIIFRLGDVVLLEEEEEPIETAMERRRQRERGDTLRGTGIGVLALGGALGVGALITSLISPCSGEAATAGDCSDSTRKGLGIGFAVSGGLAIVGGITMIAVGAKRSRVQASLLPTRGGAAFNLQGRF